MSAMLKRLGLPRMAAARMLTRSLSAAKTDRRSGQHCASRAPVFVRANLARTSVEDGTRPCLCLAEDGISKRCTSSRWRSTALEVLTDNPKQNQKLNVPFLKGLSSLQDAASQAVIEDAEHFSPGMRVSGLLRGGWWQGAWRWLRWGPTWSAHDLSLGAG